MVPPQGLGELKISMTSSEIASAIFWLVAEPLNHMRNKFILNIVDVSLSK
jgi:hypothetical protein